MKFSGAGLTTAAVISTVGLLILASGCSVSNEIDNVRASKTVAYAPGVPNFDMEAIATARDGQTGVDVYLGIPHFSLVFQSDSAQYTAPYELNVQVLTQDGENLLTQQTWTDTVRVINERRTRRFQPLALTKHLAVAPGSYIVRTVLRDANSDTQANRLQRIQVPDLAGSVAQLGPLRMESAAGDDTFEPVVTLHIPSNLDSLRATADLYNAVSADQAEVTTKLVRFESDSGVADPPYWLTPMSSSLEYRGIDYGDSDTIDVHRHRIRNISQHTALHYDLPDLEPGIYRILTTVRVSGLDDTTGTVTRRRIRNLSVKGEDFPQIASLEEVVDALTYIARDRELKEIRQTSSLDSMRRRFDAFWGERTSNKEAAANLLETYYGRVEEANLYFTTHKAGWKTDRGMLYIVLGAPVEVDYYVDSEVWYYSYSAQDPRRVYVFERGRHYDKRGLLFENFVLQRRPYYQEVWRRVINRWRSGDPMM